MRHKNPYKYLKIAIFFPWILSLMWVIFNGCPLTKYVNNGEDKGGFMYQNFKLIYPNISRNLVSEIITFITVTIVLSTYVRIAIKENLYKTI